MYYLFNLIEDKSRVVSTTNNECRWISVSTRSPTSRTTGEETHSKDSAPELWRTARELSLAAVVMLTIDSRAVDSQLSVSITHLCSWSVLLCRVISESRNFFFFWLRTHSFYKMLIINNKIWAELENLNTFATTRAVVRFSRVICPGLGPARSYEKFTL